MLCIDRLISVLTNLATTSDIQFDIVGESADLVEIRDLLYGTGRFVITAEIIAGRDVLLLTKMFPALEGNVATLSQAYLRLLNLNAGGHGVSIGIEEGTGAVGATITFKCDEDLEQLEMDMHHYMCTMTTFMEAHFDAVYGEMLELGVIAYG